MLKNTSTSLITTTGTTSSSSSYYRMQSTAKGPVFGAIILWFLANVNSHSLSLYAVARPSVCRLSECSLLRWLKFSAIFLWR